MNSHEIHKSPKHSAMAFAVSMVTIILISIFAGWLMTWVWKWYMVDMFGLPQLNKWFFAGATCTWKLFKGDIPSPMEIEHAKSLHFKEVFWFTIEQGVSAFVMWFLLAFAFSFFI